MKRLLSIVICFCIVLSCAAVSAETASDENTEIMLFGTNLTEDSGTGAPTGMTGIGSLSRTDAANGNPVVCMSGSASMSFAKRTKPERAELVKINISFCPVSDIVGAYFSVGNSGTNKDIIILNTNGTFAFYADNGADAEKYARWNTETWYEAEILLDFTNQKFSLTLNGDEIAKDAALNFTDALSGIWGTWNTNTVFYAGDITAKKLIKKAKISDSNFVGNDIEVLFNKEMNSSSFNAVKLFVGEEEIPMSFAGDYNDKKYILSDIGKMMNNATYSVLFGNTVFCIDDGLLTENSVSVKRDSETERIGSVIFSSGSSIIENAGEINGNLTANVTIDCQRSPLNLTSYLCLYSDDTLLDFDEETSADSNVQLSVTGNGNRAAVYVVDDNNNIIDEKVLAGSLIHKPQPTAVNTDTKAADLNYNIETGIVKVFGKTDAYSSVFARAKAKSEVGDNINYAAITKTISFDNGYYEMFFKLDENKFLSDDYVVEIMNVSGAAPIEFKFSNSKQATDSLENVNGATSSEKITEEVIKNSKAFGVDLTDYNMLYDDAAHNRKENVGKYLLENRPPDGYEKSSNVNIVFNKAVAVNKINEKKSSYNTFIKYAQMFDCDSSVITDINQSEYIAEIIEKRTFTSFTQFNTLFNDIVMLCNIYSADTPAKLKKLITETYNSQIQPMQNTQTNNIYRKINENSLVYSKLLNVKFYDTAQIRDAFEKSVFDVYENQKEKASSGGGGGGGRGSSGNAVAPPIKEQSALKSAAQDKEDISSVQFFDLDKNTTKTNAIISLAEKGVVSGDGNGNFHPKNTIKRCEFMKMLVLTFDISVAGAQSDFADVPKTDWSYNYISNAYSSGIVYGKGNGFFDKDGYLNREEMFTIIFRTANYCGYLKESAAAANYTDYLQISEYAKNAINVLSEYGIAQAFKSGEFSPVKSATREDAAYALWQCLALVGGTK